MIHGSYITTYWDGYYNAIGIGSAKDCHLKFKNLYMGDIIENGNNPLPYLDFNKDYWPQ